MKSDSVGHWVSWYENGNKKYEKYYKNGKRDSLFISYHSNGQKMVHGNFLYGEMDGLWSYWTEDGEMIRESLFSLTSTISKDFHPNGMLKTFYSTMDSLRHGTFTEYYNNGKKKEEGMYRNGKKIKMWTLYYRDGEVQNTEWHGD